MNLTPIETIEDDVPTQPIDSALLDELQGYARQETSALLERHAAVRASFEAHQPKD